LSIEHIETSETLCHGLWVRIWVGEHHSNFQGAAVPISELPTNKYRACCRHWNTVFVPAAAVHEDCHSTHSSVIRVHALPSSSSRSKRPTKPFAVSTSRPPLITRGQSLQRIFLIVPPTRVRRNQYLAGQWCVFGVFLSCARRKAWSGLLVGGLLWGGVRRSRYHEGCVVVDLPGANPGWWVFALGVLC